MAWECFLVRETGNVSVSLRTFSFTSSRQCPLRGNEHGHVAIAKNVQVIPATSAKNPEGYYSTNQNEDGTIVSLDGAYTWAVDAFPQVCACGYAFDLTSKEALHDMVVVDYDEIWTDGEQEWLGKDLPVGALWEEDPRIAHDWKGQDGRSFVVKLPPGGAFNDWHIDGPSSTGGHWQREGEPPNLTVRPSIMTGEYHGFLQNGVLTDDTDGRQYRDQGRQKIAT